MEINTRTTCTECNGQGLVTPGIWIQFYHADEEFQKANGRCMDEKEMYAWFNNEGVHRIPQEEVECHTCGGEGKIQSWISVEEFLKSQSNLISKYLNENAGK